MRILPAWCVLAVLCLPVAPAAGATVTGHGGTEVVEVRDGGGERNRLEILGRRTVVIRDRRPLTARGTCRRMRPHAVRCPGSGEVRVYAGRGDDRVDVLAGDMTLSVLAGPGSDRVDVGTGGGWLRGGRGADVLRGGGGRDIVLGGAGDDRLNGGDGDDHLDGDARTMNAPREGAAGDDVLAGGRGRDTASWEQRRRPVRVDLERQTATSAVDSDRLRSVESATGGRGSDHLVGDGRRNRLEGGAGRDLLAGRAGDDWLDVTGRGLVVSPVSDEVPDRIECGPGDDIVKGAGADRYDRFTPEALGPHCERLTDDYGALYARTIRVQPLRVRRGRVRIPVVCSLEFSACRRRVTLYARGVRLGRSRYVRVRPEIRRVAVRLRRALPARGVIDVRVRAPRDYAFRYRLRR